MTWSIKNDTVTGAVEGPAKTDGPLLPRFHGHEPVRDWLKGLPSAEMREIGADIKTVQFGWPIGMPVVDHIDGEIWEVRTRLATRLDRECSLLWIAT